MTLPLFNFFEYPDHPQLYAALKSAGPARAWRVMNELRELDAPLYVRRRVQDGSYERLCSRAAAAMREVPDLRSAETEVQSQKFAEYGPRLQFESTFITLWLDDRETLFDEVVEVVGLDNLRTAQSLGRGVMALPLHLGPSYVVAPVMAHHIPTQAVFNRINFNEMKAAAFPGLPIDAFQLDSASTFRAGLSALRAGRAFSIFPEIDPRGIDDHHVEIPFLGTTILAPTGPMILSRTAQAPMVPVVVRPLGEGRFRLTYHPPIAAPARGEDVRESLLALWRVLESELLAGDVGEWEMWFEFDRMLARTQVAPA